MLLKNSNSTFQWISHLLRVSFSPNKSVCSLPNSRFKNQFVRVHSRTTLNDANTSNQTMWTRIPRELKFWVFFTISNTNRILLFHRWSNQTLKRRCCVREFISIWRNVLTSLKKWLNTNSNHSFVITFGLKWTTSLFGSYRLKSIIFNGNQLKVNPLRYVKCYIIQCSVLISIKYRIIAGIVWANIVAFVKSEHFKYERILKTNTQFYDISCVQTFLRYFVMTFECLNIWERVIKRLFLLRKGSKIDFLWLVTIKKSILLLKLRLLASFVLCILLKFWMNFIAGCTFFSFKTKYSHFHSSKRLFIDE